MAGRHGDGEAPAWTAQNLENRDPSVMWAPFSHLCPHPGGLVVPSLTGQGSGFLLLLAKYSPSMEPIKDKWDLIHVYIPPKPCPGPQEHVGNGRKLWSCPLGFSTWPALTQKVQSPMLLVYSVGDIWELCLEWSCLRQICGPSPPPAEPAVNATSHKYPFCK